MASKQVSPRLVVLLGLTVAAAAILVTIWPAGSADTQGSGPAPRAAVRPGEQDPAVPPALGLEAMASERAAPANQRDLFRFGAVRPEPLDREGGGTGAPGRAAGEEEPDEPAQPVEPAGPPPPPPIPLRFVGYAETPGTGKVAALSDGRFTYHGREGDVIEGRWRIVSIGVESLVIERVDGTGRQTLRLQ